MPISCFDKCGFIENWGRGTINMIEECRQHGLPRPDYEYEWSAVKVSFYKSKIASPQSIKKEVSDQVNERAQKILAFCKEPKSAQEIMNYMGVRHKSHFRENLLNPLIKSGHLALTIPDKPTSRLQKYKTVKEEY